jgi:integrase
MATVSILLKMNKINKKGEAPLYLRIIKDRKAKFVSLGYTIHPDFWDAKKEAVLSKHPNSARLNNFITKKKAEASDVALRLETESKYVPPKKIKQEILGKSSVNFFEYAEAFNSKVLSENKVGTYNKTKGMLSKLETYIGKRDFTLDEITVHFLKSYEEYLRTTLKNSTNTIHSNLKMIRRIMNLAIEEELFPFEKSPFLRYKLKLEKTTKVFLTEDELKAIEEVSLLENSMMDHHRNMYVFACYVGGLRVSDLLQLRWENFDGKHITLETQKTKDPISIRVPNKGLEILNRYKTDEKESNHFIFPFLDNKLDYSDAKLLHNSISAKTAYANNDLKDIAKKAKIKKHISMHTSRHTWATRALRKGIRIEYVSKLMGHASIQTTQIYAKIVNKELDEAMDVFND